MQAQRIINVKKIGECDSFDLEVAHPDHNFYAEGIVTSNSHAAAYAATAAVTTYLKFKYPQQFYLSLLKLSQFEPNPFAEISKIQSELQYFNLRLLPPHLVESELDFKIEGNDIRFGLSAIKGISEKTVEKLNQFKRKYANKFELFESARQAKVSIGVLSSICMAGALNGLATCSRSRLILEAQAWWLLTDKEKVLAMKLGKEFNYSILHIITHLAKTNDEKGKPYIKPSRHETIKKHYEPYKQIYLQNNAHEDFACWWYEKKALGYCYSHSLKDIFSKVNPNIVNLMEFKALEQDDYGEFMAIVTETISGTAKNAKKTKYLKILVQDESGPHTVLVFNDKIEKIRDDNTRLPKEDDIIYVRGKKMADACFADNVVIQNLRIFTKLSELKDKAAAEDEKVIVNEAVVDRAVKELSAND